MKLFSSQPDGFEDFRESGAYKAALQQVVTLGDARANGRRGIQDMLSFYTSASTPANPHDVLPPSEECFVNFYSLGCRFAGYLGPFNDGFIDAQKSVDYALKMGCRTFILEIGHAYSNKCGYFPRIIIRDKQGKKINVNLSSGVCESSANSSIKAVCEALKQSAFNDADQGPLVIVLYVLDIPPPSGREPNRLLDFYSNIAKGLAPLADRRIDNIVDGGTFARQKNEAGLLTNKISDYNGRVIVMCNVDTSTFVTRKDLTYTPDEDLNYWVNLKLSMKLEKMGATTKADSTAYGTLDSVQSYLSFTGDQIPNLVEESKLSWSVCLETNPKNTTTPENFAILTSTFGVNCIPIQIWNPESDYLFESTKGMFAKYSFVPKPSALRYRTPDIAVPAEQTKSADGKGGQVRVPT